MGGQILEYEAKTILKQGIAQGIEQGIEQGREIGIEQGIAQGMIEILVTMITKKLAKGYTIPQIADVLEETEERISELIREYHLQ